jgi:2-polyprenyl-3-methyl-5-hydroxy-6-metoxy-1,4-benzoquinol methylase
MAYYTNVNTDLLANIPMNARRILEIGCGDGSFGLAVKARNPQVQYFGVELFEEVALIAQTRLDKIVIGDIENDDIFQSVLALHDNKPFDALIFGDVLEHLRDPWSVLKKLRGLMSPKGICVACIPNIGHWSIHTQLLKGRWDYADAGLLDRTHLRFFTHETMREMFTSAGWTVCKSQSRIIQYDKTMEALKTFEPLIASQGLNAAKAKQDLAAFQWIISASNGPPDPPIYLAALTIKKMAGVNEARIDNPLTTLKSLPNVRAVWGEGSLAIPNDYQPGVFILHRQFVSNKAIAQHIERLIEKGWVIVSDIDDDPGHWAGYVDSDFIAFRGVHAVSVSTDKLAARMSMYNPNLAVLNNAIFELPQLSEKPSAKSGKLRVFFGALNRIEDWNEIKPRLLPALSKLEDQIEFVVVHDRDIFNSLPQTLKKEFHPTLQITDYLKLLGSCDIALLPLRDTPFNHLKSDIKLIECCANGVVPIFSDVVYADTRNVEDLGVMLKAGNDWGQALTDLVENQDQLLRLRTAGFDYATTQRMFSQNMGQRLAWLEALIANKDQLEKQRLQRLKTIGLSSLVVGP